ncbi:hypothetical protein [Streptomyces cyaneofuscatus]|uniref:hypothetical protein n=1 Tax=Streptomyces cyaneofuscatus TaxID=66883 RepID=UPI00342D9516
MRKNNTSLSRKVTVAVALAAAVAGVTAWSATAQSETVARRDAQPERIMKGREVFHFKSVAEMASTSAAVVHAEVVDVKPGRIVGDAESGGADQAREVTLSVDTSFRRPFVSAPSTIVLEEWGWDEKGNGYQVGNVAWSEVGDKGYYFLARTDDPSRWRLVSTQGRALEAPEFSLTSSADPNSEIHREIQSLDPLGFTMQLKRLLDTKNPSPDLPQPLAEPEGLTGSAADAPAPDDGAEEPIPDDSVNDGSEPGDGG